MITKQEFDSVSKDAISNFNVVFPKMVNYKNYIQREILNLATRQELEDVRDCRINYGMVNKLACLAKGEWQICGDALSLYSAAMAVATIIKEYDWGTAYLTGDGLWSMALKIQNA